MAAKKQVTGFASEVQHILIPNFLKLDWRAKAMPAGDIGKWSVVQFRFQVRPGSAFCRPAENILSGYPEYQAGPYDIFA